MFVKLCGFTRHEDIEKILDLNISAAGFIFYKASKRYVKPVVAKELCEVLRGSGIAATGVFVDDDADTIKSIADYAGLDMLQVYSSETAAALKGFLPVISCFRVKQEHTADDLPVPQEGGHILFDTFDSGSMGGTGKAFSSSILKSYRFRGRMIVAGGINSGNIGSLVRDIKPFGVDISSGIETEPGIKSPDKIKEILEIIAEAENDSIT
ncbi:MAG TPA: phosphoribosylanthranilate isomerase [Spirochaetota bacterium]|nr:phosphoribosylanthranilate isomerase [Spirochaetota bacterium]